MEGKTGDGEIKGRVWKSREGYGRVGKGEAQQDRTGQEREGRMVVVVVVGKETLF